MRKLMSFSLLVAAFFALATMPLTAQDTEQELSAFAQKWQEAFNRGDHATLATMYTQEVVFLNADGTTNKVSSEQIGAQFEQDFKAATSEIDIKLTRMMSQPGGKVKISGTFSTKNTDSKSGETSDTNGTFNHEVVKEGNHWKLCQISISPN